MRVLLLTLLVMSSLALTPDVLAAQKPCPEYLDDDGPTGVVTNPAFRVADSACRAFPWHLVPLP